MKRILYILLLLPCLASAQWKPVGNALQMTADGLKFRTITGSRNPTNWYTAPQVDSLIFNPLTIGGLRTFSGGVSSSNYFVTNSSGTSIYQIYNDSTRMVIKPYDPNASSTGYDITQDLPTGYVTNGTVDYTSVIQNALNTHLHVSMPPFPVGIYFSTPTGLIVQSGATIDFPTGAQLVMLPNAQTGLTYNYGFFKLQLVNNVTFNNINLVGDYYTHLATLNGSGGHSVYLFGCDNIVFNQGSISRSAGDGIYVGRTSYSNGNVNSTHILINNVNVSYNGRNGISLTSVNYCLLQNVTANYEESISPYAGIDIEPSSNPDIIDHIVINNPICLNTIQTANGGIITLGISLGLRRYYTPDNSFQTPFTIASKVTNVTINNPILTGANIGIKEDIGIKSTDTNPNNITITGQFIVNNPRFASNWGAANSSGSIDANFVYTVYNPVAYNKFGVLLAPFSAIQAYLYHNDNQPGTLQIVNQAANGSAITTVSGITTPPPPGTSSGVYVKDSDIHDFSGNTFLKTSTGVSLTGSYSNPLWLADIPYYKITATPTTIAGYGITDNLVIATGTTPLTTGGITYADATGKLTSNSSFLYFDNTTGNTGIRATGVLPGNLTLGNGASAYYSNVADLVTNQQYVRNYWNSGTFHISSNAAGTLTARPFQIDIGLGALSTSSLLLNSNGVTVTDYSSFPIINGLRVNGNAAAPTAVVSGNTIASFGGTGYNGTANSGTAASMELFSSENFTTTGNGTGMRFATTPTGSITKQYAFYVQPSGDVIVGQPVSQPANFQVVQTIASTAGKASTIGTSTTVTGTNTEFTNTFHKGSLITINGETRTVVSVASDILMTTDAWTNTNTSAVYTVPAATLLQVRGSGDVYAPTSITSSIFYSTATPTTIAGSTSGNIVCTMPQQGASDKKVVINVVALNGSAVYTFPTPFTYTPAASLSLGTMTVTTTSISISTGSATSGVIVLQGF